MVDINQYGKVEGTFIRLEKLKPEDAELIYEWRISESGAFMNQPEGYSLASQKQWMQNRPASEINYMIICKNKGEKVGMIAIVNISHQDKNAEVGRLLLAPVYLKKSNPYGLEALKLCCNVVINEWKFNKINGNVLATNTPMLKLQKYLGMVEEGLLKEQKVIKGIYHDLYLVALFPKQLNTKYLPRISLLLKSFS